MCSHGCFCVDEECVLPVTLAAQMCVWSAAPLCVSWCVFECLSPFWSDCLFLSVSDRWRPTDTELLSWMFRPVSPLSRRVSAALPSPPPPSASPSLLLALSLASLLLLLLTALSMCRCVFSIPDCKIVDC